MRFSTALSLALVLLPALHQVSAGPYHHRRQNDRGRKGGNGGNGGNNGGNGGSTPVALPSGTTPPAAGNSPPPNVPANNNNNNNGGNNEGNGGGNNGGGGNNNNGDPQTSLTVDSRVIGQGFAQNGQNPPVAGQVPSLTTTNNFINYCLTVPNLPITNGQQIQSGSCNPIPIGEIPSSDNIPSSKFVFPKNGAQIPANQQFTVQMSIKNLVTGNFVNAQANYFAAPQQLQNGVIKGHSHVVIQALTSLDQTTPPDPKVFAFFKGLNEAAQGGTLSAVLANGLPAGAYRMCSINTAANHQPAVVPIAQHGGIDDCSYFEAVVGGGNNGGGNNNGAPNTGGGNNNANNGAPSAGAPSPTSPAAPGPSPPNGGGGNGGGNGRDGGGGGGGKGGR